MPTIDGSTPDGVTTTQVSAQDGGSALAPGGAGAGEAGAAPTDVLPPKEAAQVQQGKVTMIPHAQFARVKQEEFNKGKTAALDEIAKASGYESHADLVAALGKLKTLGAQPQGEPKTPPTEKPKGDEEAPTPDQVAGMRAEKRELQRVEKMNEKLLTERNRYAQQAVSFKTQMETLQSQISDLQAERELMRTGFEVGLKDVDYAIRLLQKHVAGLPPQEAEKFDERAFFQSLRKPYPYLFGETAQPATTGTGPGGAPTAPKPAAVAGAAATNGSVDVRQMTPTQYKEHLRARGISP